jgi:hypothetical protein
MYRRILGPVYENENWRILTKKFMQLLKTHHNRDNKVTLAWKCTENGRK